MVKIGVLVSGGGTNLQALIDAIEGGEITGGKIVLVLSSKYGVKSLKRAFNHGIKSTVVARKEYSNSSEYDKAILDELKDAEVDLVVMAGFLSVIGDELINAYPNKIINIHPSLIPAFCGDGFYGLKVHEGVLERGCKITGATVHFVNNITDGGPIILQKAVEVSPIDTPEELQKRVMEEAEWKILPKAVDLFCNEKLKVIGNKVLIFE